MTTVLLDLTDERDQVLLAGWARSLRTPRGERCHIACWEQDALCGAPCELPPGDACEYRKSLNAELVCRHCERVKCVDCIAILRGLKGWPARAGN